MVNWIPKLTALIPLFPLAAAGVIAWMPRRAVRPAIATALAMQGLAFLMALAVFGGVLAAGGENGLPPRGLFFFDWFRFGETPLTLGVIADPLNASMLLMVALVTLLIFVYSIGYMRDDPNVTRFFGFLSLFSGAMLGVVAANSLLLLFICWELVGLASYLLIGFWFTKPSAAAAARKAFVTTRIGDLGLFLGMLWLYKESGTLLFYEHGNGIMEQPFLSSLAGQTAWGGMALSTAAALLLFCGAVGKSGQVPLHVWLPDAMEGPTPVSALIHAATMVAAGVFLVARTFPLFAAGAGPEGVSTALTVVTWTGALTALFAAVLAVAQYDLKRILAYSTVSQLGFMMLAMGTGGVAAGMFHLLAHAFFKALLFMGAGSVIHGCHGEQDIRLMGGLRKTMPFTFALYGIGMMALAGFPFVFSGFWSKEAILVSAVSWPASKIPFFMALTAAALTAFYMTRQMIHVFFGAWRGGEAPHESGRLLLIPLIPLAAAAILLGFLATPAWPWFGAFLQGSRAEVDFAYLFSGQNMAFMLLSICLVILGVGAGWLLYRNKTGDRDPLEQGFPRIHRLAARRLLVDEFYGLAFIRPQAAASRLLDLLDRLFRAMADLTGSLFSRFLAEAANAGDRLALNAAFDRAGAKTRAASQKLCLLHNGRAQTYLRMVGLGMVFLLILYAWLLK